MSMDTAVVISTTDEPVDAGPPPVVPETPVTAPETPADRPRDEQGRFIPAAAADATPVPEEPPPAADATPDALATDTPVPEPAPKKGSPQERINQAIKKQREAERRAEAVELELLALKATHAPPAPSPETPSAPVALATDPDAPKETDYDTWEAWQDARVAHAVRRETTRIARETKEQAARDEATKATQAAMTAHAQRVTKGQTLHADWDEVVGNPDIKTSPPMEDAIIYSDVGHEVMYYLGKNPAEAARIYALPPALALKEMGKLEARVEAALVTGSAPRGPAIRTPPPITPVGGGSHISTLDPDQMTPLEYHKFRNEQRAQRARG
jgi:chemotaxis protein histidine kinase CheA